MIETLNGATRVHFIVGDPIAQVKSPAGVTQATFIVDGAQGGTGVDINGQGTGGLGARVQVKLAVSPGQTFQLMVGGAGLFACFPMKVSQERMSCRA